MSHWRLRTPFRGRQKPRGRVTVGRGVWEQMPLLLLCFHAEGKTRFDFLSTHNCRLTVSQTVKLYEYIIGRWHADCWGICVSRDTATHQETVSITNQFDMRIKTFTQVIFVSSDQDLEDDSCLIVGTCSLHSVCFRYSCTSADLWVQQWKTNLTYCKHLNDLTFCSVNLSDHFQGLILRYSLFFIITIKTKLPNCRLE